MSDWRPSASVAVLRKRAELLSAVRHFFAERKILEVDVPVLGEYGVTDLHIDSIQATCHDRTHFLQSSPEYFMKRLLAAGSGDIYSLGKAFRDGEVSRRHNPEFTMLEWYRVGWDERQLMDEAIALVKLAMGDQPVIKASYADLFKQFLQLDPHTVCLSLLQELAAKTANVAVFAENRSTCLDLVFSLLIEPQLPVGIVAVYDYPACQAALAQITEDAGGRKVARRFELFVDGMELANGYFELCDAVEQRQRFVKDLTARQQANKSVMSADQRLLAAMDAGLPACAGVAIGLDRLLMASLHIKSIAQVVSFTR